jgi:predicted butyrate kinase (DUF1464 family)
MTDLPILELRRIEANIIKPIYEEMVERLGKQQAQEILGSAIEKAAIEQGAALAAEAPEGASLRSFIGLFERWKAGGALEVDVIKLERTQTIMGGASHCDFRYTVEE